jgi:ABC-type amino acid transport substrate-binding protein
VVISGFSTPYYENSALFVGQQGKFTGIDQLKGKKVGVQSHYRRVAEDGVNAAVLQIQFGILVAVIRNGGDFTTSVPASALRFVRAIPSCSRNLTLRWKK